MKFKICKDQTAEMMFEGKDWLCVLLWICIVIVFVMLTNRYLNQAYSLGCTISRCLFFLTILSSDPTVGIFKEPLKPLLVFTLCAGIFVPLLFLATIALQLWGFNIRWFWDSGWGILGSVFIILGWRMWVMALRNVQRIGSGLLQWRIRKWEKTIRGFGLGGSALALGLQFVLQRAA